MNDDGDIDMEGGRGVETFGTGGPIGASSTFGALNTPVSTVAPPHSATPTVPTHGFGAANAQGGLQGHSGFPMRGFGAVNVPEESPAGHFECANAQGGPHRNSVFSMGRFGAVNVPEESPASHFGSMKAQDKPHGNVAAPPYCFGAANTQESPESELPGRAEAVTAPHHNLAREHDNASAFQPRRVRPPLPPHEFHTPPQHRSRPQITPHHPSASSTADPWTTRAPIYDASLHPLAHTPDPWANNNNNNNNNNMDDYAHNDPVHRAPTDPAPPDPWGYNKNRSIRDENRSLHSAPMDNALPDPWNHNANKNDDPWGTLKDPWAAAAPCDPWDNADKRTSTTKTQDPWADKRYDASEPHHSRPSQIGQLWGTQPAQIHGSTSQVPNSRKEHVCPGPASQVTRPRKSEAPDIVASQLMKPKQVLLEAWVTWLQALTWLDMPFDKFHLGRDSTAEKLPTDVKSFLVEHNAQVILDRAYRDCCGTVPFMLVLVEEVVLAAYDVVVRARDPTGCIGLCLHRGFVQAVPSASHLGTVLFLRDVSFLRCPTNLQGDLETYCVVTMPSFVHAISQNDVPPDVTRELRARLQGASQ